MEEKEPNKTRGRAFKSIAVLILVVIGCFVVAVLLKPKDYSLNPPKPDQYRQQQNNSKRPAPDFSLPGLDGKTGSLSDYRGRVVLLNIWATWCPTCVEEMPSMQKLYGQMKDKGLEILTVSIDDSGARAVAPFMQRHKLSFPALLDPGGKTVQRLYRITGVPESFIVGKEGNIEKVIIGSVDWATPEAIRFFTALIERPRQPG